MKIQTFIQTILHSIKRTSGKSTRRKLTTIVDKITFKQDYSAFVVAFNEALQKNNIEVTPAFTVDTPKGSWLNFRLQQPLQTTPAQPLTPLSVADDFFKHLFEFESPEVYEQFQATLDSFSPLALFIIPEEEDFYSEIIEKVLSFELLRKRQYRSDFKIGDIGQIELTQFDTDKSGNDQPSNNVWTFYDIYNFNQKNLEQVILGENGAALIQAEHFHHKFNQLALYANKYYSDPFYLLFKCPTRAQIEAKSREDVLHNLVAQVNQKFPHVFTLRCKYARQSDIPKEVLKTIYQHFQLLLEVPHYTLDHSLPLTNAFSLLQKAQKLAESQLLLQMNPAIFNRMQWNYENDEFLYLQYFALNTLHKHRGYALEDLATNANISRYHADEDYEFSSNPDVMVKNELIVEIKTLSQKIRDKNIYLDLISSIKNESKGWKKNLKEFWLVIPGFEAARNYYKLKKTQEILQDSLRQTLNKRIKVKILAPDYIKHVVIPLNFRKVDLPTQSTQIASPRVPQKLAKPKNKTLSFGQVKGLHEEKAMLQDLIQLQNEHHQLGLGGIIFYGLSGCGKTYLSHAFANELGRHFFTFSPADIQSMWIGQTQKNIKDIFSQAFSKSPSMLFMDELESIGFSRNNPQAHTDQKATINQLLIEMNNIDENNVLVVGATNKISQLDAALKRSGRFDLKIPIFPPNAQERAEIFQYYIEKLNTELAQKQRTTLKMDQVFFNYLGEESIGLTSSDIKTLINRLRIDALLKKTTATNKDHLITRIKRFIQDGQRTLKKDDVQEFINECERNDQYSPKIEFLRDEWNI
ncbi:hypothetical protein BKI52_07075 [marine bacterium AO1-C]|nr:hypothetical protein BKI52_07075 [marine bacterium AO1-C]